MARAGIHAATIKVFSLEVVSRAVSRRHVAFTFAHYCPRTVTSRTDDFMLDLCFVFGDIVMSVAIKHLLILRTIMFL